MSGSLQDSCQWLSVTEETLFLHDGLIRVTDLVELPRDVNNSHEADNEVISFDLKNPKELSNRLLAVCGTQNNAYSKLLEYRLNALRGYWNAQRQVVLDEQNDREASSNEETLAILKKQGLYKEPEQASFSTRISVLLVLPLLQSQSRIDSSLCGVTSELLLNCLRDCAPLSLSKEPGDCLRGLENLLCSWLGEKTSDENVRVVEDPHQREIIASALVALACARGHLKIFIHAVHLLQNLQNLESLQATDVLGKLLETEGGHGQPTSVLGSKHILCWGFEDLLSIPEKENATGSSNEKEKEKPEAEIGRSLACDGAFLFTTNFQGRGLAKIGSGLHGTLRGYVYSRNLALGPGKVAYGNGLLIFRPASFDTDTENSNFCHILDPSSLKPVKTLPTPHGFKSEGPQTTIGFCSDGCLFFWIWMPVIPGDKSAKGISVYLEVFDVNEEKVVIPVQPQVTLVKKDEVGAKSLNESFLSKLRPFRGSTSTATLVALTGGDPLSSKKEEPSGTAGNTSCSISLKNLMRTPVFCDGTTVVLLTSPVGSSTSTSTTRSLFGGGSGLSGLRLLASNMCFTVETGQFNTRSDLSDAPTCALGRGASLQGLGVCFDVRNNMIWTCSSDWVDQFFNPGHQSPHHIHKRLKVTDQVVLPQEGTVPTAMAVRCILQHVGSMCLHQINNDLLHSPLGNCLLQQHSVDLVQLRRIYDILQKAMVVQDSQTIICTLVIMQLLLKISLFKLERPAEIQILKETRELLWKLLTSDSTEVKDTQIYEEICHVITVGISILYPSISDKNQLLQTLLYDGRNNEALQKLRDLILVDFADKLRAQAVEKEETKYLRLSDGLVYHILKITVQESSKLLSDAANLSKTHFEQMLSSVPIASPCLRYMMALQSHLLREAVLYRQNAENSSEEQDKTMQELMTAIVQLASRIFSGSCEVLEVLLTTCNSVIHKFKEEREARLQGLERIAKATILGHLLPVLLTALNHVNLHCLPLADELMPKLVNLVLLSSQAALLLKSQVEAVMQDDLDSDTDTHVMELMAPTVDIDDISSEDTEEQGFLAGLKIPAPWSSGKTVESIHPVRDNYRFKETVHIPGARCLYLRFDPRSSSQYDYDKLVIYAGPTTNSRKVLEYGGNTFGFGSRSVLGSGWPKDLVKVDGDTVTFSFEMRSGREHNTPDKAMWGFLVTVRAQESTEEVSSGLPFLADLALGLSVLACTMLHLLYKGPETSKEEVSCQHLLKSKLLQRCVWQSGSDPRVLLDSSSPTEDTADTSLARIRLSAEILQHLRKMCRRQAIQLRPSIRDVVNPEDLEERIVSAVLKHLSLQETVFKLPKAENQQTEEFVLLRTVIQEVYAKIDGLLRQLQSLAELEQRWHNEVRDHNEGNTTVPPFFSDFHLQETKGKELAMLCFVKDVSIEMASERAVKVLREKFDNDVGDETFTSVKPVMPRTQHIMRGLRARLDLLLQVTIAPGEGIHVARSISNNPENVLGVMVRSDTDVLSQMSRSISAPNGVECFQDDSVLEINIKQRKRKSHRRTPSSVLQDLVDGEGRDKPPHTILIDQLFSFIGSSPEKAISPKDFLAAAATRLKRGNTRKQALIHMKELLTAATKVGGATHLVAAVTSVLQSGPGVDELTCGGMVPQVREAFAETMTAVVQLAAKYPIACSNSIGLLCTIPYTRAEEKCLVRSGLVHLLDKLCSLANLRSDTSDTQSVNQKVSAMAWAGFQVLANRCVMWETEDGSGIEELEHSGLARQVSTLLTNHLARATECIGNEAAGTEALQDVLSLLNTLARSRMGRAILSQPACVSKLLSLLLDQRPSPKLVLIILQLCRVALPLMNTADCELVELPVWGQHLTTTHWNTSEPITDPPAKIVSLLLAKLGDFLVPGDYATLVSRRPSMDLAQGKSQSSDKDKSEESDIQAGKLSVFIHKREDQLSHEVIQPLLGSDNRPFRIGGGANMERVVRMDREMTKLGKAEVTTEDAISALKKAAKWAQMGLVVSTGPPVEGGQADTPTGDKKKQPVDVVCREKNTELARTDPIRPFISGHVANNMATEVISLLHGLLSAPETHTTQSWPQAVQRVLHNSLSCLPLLLASLDTLSSPRCNSRQLMSMSKMANAALCALGGFTEVIKPGCEVKMLGPGIDDSSGTVVSVSEQTGMATVQLDHETEEDRHPRFSDTVQVPINRIIPVRNEIYKSTNVPVTESLVMAIKAILLPQDDGTCPLQQILPVAGDGSSLNNQVCRVVAELETRACIVLAQYLHDIEFTKEFIQHCGSTIDILKSLAKDCNSGDRLSVVEGQCSRLRLLYRDCAKPPPPPSKLDCRANQEMVLDANRSFPPVRASVFSQAMTGVTFLGDPSTGSGLPRGTMIYANQPIPQQAPAFYWELEICSFGDSQEESGAVISFGFAPSADKKDGAWTNPVGTCLCLNNGKAVHYNGASLLQWRSVRLDVTLNAGDIAGIGWERTGESPVQGQTPKGRVYFTYNGRRLNAYMDDVSGGMYPVVHIQKKNTRIRANFGTRPFAFAEGQQHKEAADAANDLTREIRESFCHLPFHPQSDSENEGSSQQSPDASIIDEIKTQKGPPCKTAIIPKPQNVYNPEECLAFKLFSCYDNFVTTGPDQRGPVIQDDESDDETVEDDGGSEDHYALLVKAWEQKVFPIIRRRFRNEAERKDGLEQIRGALQLGMTDIARQTVEFLYEENGGIPRDLHLPTIENIKEDLAKFTIERVRKGTTVVIRNTAETSTAGTTVLPKFAVRSMLKTFGLTGNVLDVDNSNEIVQVEVYLRSEGVLVRFWYPIEMLERPPQGLRKSSITGGQILDTSNIFIHRELLNCESVLAKMYCRTALLKLIDHCNSPAMDIVSCSASLGSGMAASAALLQQLDIENLQLLSNELLCPPQAHGTVMATSLTTASSLKQCLANHMCSLTKILYKDEDKLKRELAVAIARAANQGEDYLIELTTQICLCFQTAPEMFPYEEFAVTEVKVNTDLHFPGAGCLVVSCKTDPKATKKDTSLYKSPWARVFSYSGQRVKKTGNAAKLEVISYPRDTTSTSNQNEQYTPVIIPTDRVHVRLGVSPPPGIILTIHALPPQFLLAVAYIETLINEKYGCGTKSCGSRESSKMTDSHLTFQNQDCHDSLWSVDNIVITPPVFRHMIELLCRHLWMTNTPAIIKEYLFHLLAQSLRILHYSEGCNSSKLPTLNPHLNPSTGLLVQLQIELRRLYEEETKGWPSGTLVSGTGIGIGFSDKGRFSTYFHALMEVNLAVAELRYEDYFKPPPSLTAPSSFPSSALETASSSTHPLSSPTSSAKRKKLKAKRDKERGGAVPKRSTASQRTSESDSSVSVSSASSADVTPSSSSASAASASPSTSGTSIVTGGSEPGKGDPGGTNVKMEDILWLHRAVTVSKILRCLGFKEKHGKRFLNDAVSDAAKTLTTPSMASRMLVITGIPPDLSPDTVKQAIRASCNANGGLDRDEIFLPELDVPSDTPEVPSVLPDFPQPSTQQVEEAPAAADNKDKQEETSIKHIKGYAVINVVAKAKLENVKKALFRNKVLVSSLTKDQEEAGDVPEEMLSITTVLPTLIGEPHANIAIEEYLQHKFFTDGHQKEMSDSATVAFTEIFHSCFIMEHKQGGSEFRHESGFICLGKDQILQNVQENLLCVFLNNIRPPKKSLTEQTMHILRRYGMLKSPDKEMSPSADKPGRGKPSKKSPRGSKEKVVLGVVEKVNHKDRKSKGKDFPEKSSKEGATPDPVSTKGVKHSWMSEEARYLTLDGFLQYVLDSAKQDIRGVWRAIAACGFDIHFERCACLDASQAFQMAGQWIEEMDSALVLHINSLSRKLSVATALLHPHEIHISEEVLTNEMFTCLQGIPLESIRLRFALLQSLNNTLETFFLPLVDLRATPTYNRSSAALLSQLRGLIFYDTKVNLMNRILNATEQRKSDQAAPEITLDPLETILREEKNSQATWLCQAYRQLVTIPSRQFCVRLASGGDPTYAFNVRLTGEEVHGTSGSFRQFLWQAAKEISGPLLRLLIPCNNSDNKGRYIFRPGPMSYSEERLLQFFGQMLGITMRADIPLGMDMLSCFWKLIVGTELDPVQDLKEADQLTYNYIKKIEMVETESELQALCSGVFSRFIYSSLAGEEVELINKGGTVHVCWENRQEYVDAIRRLRFHELLCQDRVRAVHCGLASVIPLQLMAIMSPLDLEIRTCGLPVVDLDFLKAHTMYQVGLMDTDQHIQFFWNTLSGLSQEDLGKFIKFACNQERIPQSCPCRNGNADSMHVPPYPMKIAPPDGLGQPDSRYIRVETCMFMIKLPQYSSQEVMTQRLMYAINCREDPLSG
ncbi:probable E3 ubiquitin-protein ligase HECTD4 isoform X2 [Ostrea edulis]|uniref:probable E3 ubiquitin-protein ligase HECTD4 isoform X2 n=1 Tax=Ostrea edulis TaxID=37623 RepID=UPI0024AED407|nr:probable E3 ubiquitin-protein ligase HECTD4 isoform X2 [Ostrea edulis]